VKVKNFFNTKLPYYFYVYNHLKKQEYFRIPITYHNYDNVYLYFTSGLKFFR